MHPPCASRPLLLQLYICKPTISCIWFPWTNLLHQHITKKPISKLQSLISLKYPPSLALPPLWSIQLFDLTYDAPTQHGFFPAPFAISPLNELWIGFQPVVVVQKNRNKWLHSSSNRPLAILIYSNGKQLQYLQLHHRTTQPFDAAVFPFSCMSVILWRSFLKNGKCMPPFFVWIVTNNFIKPPNPSIFVKITKSNHF